MKEIVYESYIRDNAWKVRRQSFIEKRKKLGNYVCEDCGNAKDLQVHHRNYRRLGNEKDIDLALKCRECHSIFHEIQNIRKMGEQKMDITYWLFKEARVECDLREV